MAIEIIREDNVMGSKFYCVAPSRHGFYIRAMEMRSDHF